MERRQRGALLLWCVGLVAGTAFFHGLGSDGLAPPPLEPAAWSAWVAAREPAVAVVAVLRLVVLGLCWYLVGVTTIGLVARLLRAAQLIRVADALTVPWLRRLLQQGLGVALATAMVTSAAGAAPTGVHRPGEGMDAAAQGTVPRSAPAEEAVAGTPEVGAGATAAPDRAGQGGVGLDALPIPVPFGGGDGPLVTGPDPVVPLEGEAGPVGSDANPVLPLMEGEPPDVSAGPDEAADDALEGYVVRSGDSLWRIAEHQLTSSLGRAPVDAEIVPYWRELIERNRAGLPDPDDPDLILPGQRLELPAPPEA